MAYELRDVTIFYERMVCQFSVDLIAAEHFRSKSRIHQILRIQRQRYSYYVSNITNATRQYWETTMVARYVMQNFYHYEINCILQRYYIKLNGKFEGLAKYKKYHIGKTGKLK